MAFISTELAPGIPSADSLRRRDVLSVTQKAYIEDATGPLAGAATTCGYIPATSILDNDELTEVVELLLQGPHKSDFHKKQMQQTARQIRSKDSANFYFSYIPATIDYYAAVGDQSKAGVQLGPGASDGITWSCSLQ